MQNYFLPPCSGWTEEKSICPTLSERLILASVQFLLLHQRTGGIRGSLTLKSRVYVQVPNVSIALCNKDTQRAQSTYEALFESENLSSEKLTLPCCFRGACFRGSSQMHSTAASLQKPSLCKIRPNKHLLLHK